MAKGRKVLKQAIIKLVIPVTESEIETLLAEIGYPVESQ
jgi:hypothetical protein